MDLMQSMHVSGSGMSAQSQRMKVLSENIANADSLQSEEGGPYRRQVMTFKTELDRQTGLRKVTVDDVYKDQKTPLGHEYDPTHPLADENGFITTPNVDTLIESADMRDAQRSYEANLNAIDTARQMMSRSLDILR